MIAVDLGGTKVAAAVVGPDGALSGPTLRASTPAVEGPDAVLDAVAGLIDQVRRDAGVSPRGVAVASAGVIDPDRGIVVSATDILPGWAGTAVAGALGDRVGHPVIVLNDVQAHTLGEATHGAGRDAGSMLLVAAGTGLGGGFAHGGALLLGAHRAAGHLGHVPCPEAAGLTCSCGVEGHLECVASGSGITAAGGHRFPDAAAIAAAAAAGDPDAIGLLRLSGTALGRAIGGWANLLDPGVVVVTGGLSHAGPHWWTALTDAARAEALPVARPRIVPAELGDDAALIGAATFAVRRWEAA